jgi:glycosyltransferase involved in cell wall biosynthesis
VTAADALPGGQRPGASRPVALRFVVFGHNDWWVWERQGFSTRNAALMRELSRRDEVETVAVVDTPRFFARSHRPPGRRGEHVSQVAPGVSSVAFDFPLPLPNGWSPGRRVNERLALPGLLRRLRLATGGSGLRVLWVADPRLACLAAGLARDLLVFDAIDDWRQHTWAGRALVEEGYRCAAGQADVTFAVNPSLLEWLQPRGRVEVLPNAVDAGHWGREVGTTATVRDGERRRMGPVVGYAGMIQSRLDQELLRTVAARLPDVSFVLAGPVRRGSEGLVSGLPGNVRSLGAVPHGDLPAVLAGWDAAMVPHRRDALTASMDPLKLYEYVAAGLPVVSTIVSPNPVLRDHVRVATSPDEFAAALQEELAADTPAAGERRRQAVVTESWPARAERVLEVLRAEAARRGMAP